ncbi:integrase, partial [Campylobacter jejuni CVM 41908]
EEELKKFLDAIENADFRNNTVRNKLIIKIIIFTGIRVSEAINIKMGDISEENDLYIIRIRAKGNKYRVVMIKKELIYDLLKNVSINYMSKDALLFVTLLYKKQKDLVLVQEALGHASLNTSRIYTHFDNDKLKLAAQVAKELSDS